MKIAQVSPIFESVPPKAYGGTERVISYLTEELVKQGHEVTLFASGDSETAARLVSPIAESLRPDVLRPAWLAYHIIQMDQVSELADSFDVIHFHTDYLHFPLAKSLGRPYVTTLHGRQDLPELQPLYRHFHDVPLVSISNHQRTPLPEANWCETVYHGLPSDLHSFQESPGDYFVFIGRISQEKRVDRAIDIAKQCGVPVYIGAKIDKADEPYFNACIKPLLRDPLVQFVGEVNQREKRELLEHARALLFPIDWPEPFGLVMIEAFSCGTPVIAYRNGSVPEIMEDGVTGFVVTNQDEAVRAAKNIDAIDRKGCREAFDRRFTATHMAENYLRVYRRMLG
ncbi:glycosyltransferase family 4 protein [Noviherbaspirillum sp.]|uniref:glycosyltransferase family 4 protein n=1 Tax=Noviherbaspirillum sp. TaxID=1926288 RepID=UPI002B488971|nr:glycosyltransferase family 4 protein [Noviherbaspirillum sp.]HJV80331.1 glycosyltransferase family 4 protein [Noviherbaspirillum sp.]